MKKIFVTILSLCVLSIAANAQTKPAAKQQKPVSKAVVTTVEKAEGVDGLIKKAGIAGEEATDFKIAFEKFTVRIEEVDKDAALDSKKKEERKNAIAYQMHKSLIEIVGEEKYDAFSKLLNSQK